MCPFAVQVLRPTTSSVQLAWTDVPNTAVYKVTRVAEAAPANTVASYWGRLPRCTLTGLDSSFCYTFRVHALHQRDGAFAVHATSAPVRATTAAPPPTTLSVHRAIRNAHTFLLRRHLAARPDLLAIPGPAGLTPLCAAVQTGDRDLVDALLRAGADPAGAGPLNGRTALQLALFHGHVAIARRLVEQRADPHARDCVRHSAVEYAIAGGHEAAVRYALDVCADGAPRGDDRLVGLLAYAVAMRSPIAVIGALLDSARADGGAVHPDLVLAAVRLATSTGQDAIAAVLSAAAASASATDAPAVAAELSLA